jgi:hypothetical protein
VSATTAGFTISVRRERDNSLAQQLDTSATLDYEACLTVRGWKMATGAITDAADEPRARELTREEGRRLLDQRARRFLGMSGAEFRRRYAAGELDPDDDHVLGVALLLPLAD